MGLIWTIVAAAAFLMLFWAGARWVMGGRDEQRQVRQSEPDDGPAEERNLWPDRTGARTRQELGAREATDVSFTGHRVETQPGAAVMRPAAVGQEASAELTPTAPGAQQPTQWHPVDHGAPGLYQHADPDNPDTAPERHSSATDPMAHAPAPGPNHIPPESGNDLPPGTQP